MILDQIPGELHSDYINANYIDVSNDTEKSTAASVYYCHFSPHNYNTCVINEIVNFILQGYRKPNAFVATQGMYWCQMLA